MHNTSVCLFVCILVDIILKRTWRNVFYDNICYLKCSTISWNILKERTDVMSKRNFSTRTSWRNAEISFLQPMDSVPIFQFIYICGWKIFEKNSLRFHVCNTKPKSFLWIILFPICSWGWIIFSRVKKRCALYKI